MGSNDERNKIKILKTTACDTRAIDENFSKQAVLSDSLKHILAVMSVARAMSYTLTANCTHHDWSKINEPYLTQFYEALKTKKTGDEFKALEWYQNHIKLERHHPKDRCAEDINLLDILEMCIDCVTAGLARTGTVYPIEISDEILQKALANTVEMIKNSVVVTDSPEDEDAIIEGALNGKIAVQEDSEDIIDYEETDGTGN